MTLEMETPWLIRSVGLSCSPRKAVIAKADLLSVQCAAVRMCWDDMREPPQNAAFIPLLGFNFRPTCQGYSFLTASFPPMILLPFPDFWAIPQLHKIDPEKGGLAVGIGLYPYSSWGILGPWNMSCKETENMESKHTILNIIRQMFQD